MVFAALVYFISGYNWRYDQLNTFKAERYYVEAISSILLFYQHIELKH